MNQMLKRTALVLSSLFVLVCPLFGQELEPGAYSVSPVGVNIVVLANNLSAGDLSFDPAVPIEEASATLNTTVLGYVRTLNVLGRSGNVGIVLPYTFGNLEGRYLGEFQMVSRSGLRDPSVRYAVNLYGSPAMNLKEFSGHRRKTNLGASLALIAPLGQYDPAKLINVGTNRWSFKPEVGLSHALGRWTLEAYAGVWLFTDNKNFFNGKLRQQKAIGSSQVHVIRTFRPRLWASFDANFYVGGRTTIDGKLNSDLQRNSRLGATFAIPLAPRQSLKFAYSRGARTTVGADFDSLTLSYQFLWGGGL